MKKSIFVILLMAATIGRTAEFGTVEYYLDKLDSAYAFDLEIGLRTTRAYSRCLPKGYMTGSKSVEWVNKQDWSGAYECYINTRNNSY